jgi:hypothetical protein
VETHSCNKSPFWWPMKIGILLTAEVLSDKVKDEISGLSPSPENYKQRPQLLQLTINDNTIICSTVSYKCA